MTLRFNDGIIINTGGKYRIIHLFDGYYVVGHGLCAPINNREEGKELIKKLELIYIST